MSEPEVIAALAAATVIPVASFDRADQVTATAAALARGGVRCIEVTLRTACGEAAIAAAAELETMTVGAGTVLTAAQARVAHAAGADFAVAPGSNPAVIETCAELGLPFFPGVATPSEIDAARVRGCQILKVFPAATLGGPAFLRAVSAIYPDVRFIPTGGIGPEDLGDYLALDCVLAVGGSWLVSPELIRAGGHDAIERLARAARQHRATETV